MKLICTESFEKINKVFISNKYRQIVAFGGSRSGKTYAILQILLVYLLTNRGKKVTVWRNTRVTCRDTALDDFRQIIMSDSFLNDKFIENKSKAMFTCKSTGSRIIFEGADQIGKVLGSRQDISYFNEVTEFNKDVYLQITQRTSENIFCDYNPSKSFWLEKFRHREDTCFIHSTYKDNSMCPNEIIKQLNSYMPIDKNILSVVELSNLKNIKDNDKAKIFIKNLDIKDIDKNKLYLGWINEKEDTANKYMYDVYCIGVKSEKPTKIYHNWKSIKLEDYNNLPYDEYFGLDFGTAKPTAMVGVKFDGDKSFFIKKKIYSPAKDEGGIVRLLKNLHKAKEIRKSKDLIIADSARQSYIDNLLNSGFFITGAKKGNDSVIYGIGIVQQFNIYYVADFDIEEEYNDYSFKIDRYGEATDEPVKKDDHLMDAIRYIITYLYHYLDIKIK